MRFFFENERIETKRLQTESYSVLSFVDLSRPVPVSQTEWGERDGGGLGLLLMEGVQQWAWEEPLEEPLRNRPSA